MDYAALCDKESEETDNSGAMLLRLMLSLGMKRVYVAGFDGFSKESEKNYYDERLINSVSSDDIDRKNKLVGIQLRKIAKSIEIISLTPSIYFAQEMKHEEV